MPSFSFDVDIEYVREKKGELVMVMIAGHLKAEKEAYENARKARKIAGEIYEEASLKEWEAFQVWMMAAEDDCAFSDLDESDRIAHWQSDSREVLDEAKKNADEAWELYVDKQEEERETMAVLEKFLSA